MKGPHSLSRGAHKDDTEVLNVAAFVATTLAWIVGLPRGRTLQLTPCQVGCVTTPLTGELYVLLMSYIVRMETKV